MIQNDALDVAMGLILMYLMLSLLCTTINEYIASKLKLRAASLATGLDAIIDDPWVRGRFYAHGLIAGPSRAVAKGDDLLGPKARKTIDAMRKFVATVVPIVLPKPHAALAAPAAAPGAPAPLPTPPLTDHPSYIASMNFALALLGSLDTRQPVPGFAEVEATVASMNSSDLRTALLTAITAANGSIDELRKQIAFWFDDSMERLSGAYKRNLKVISAIIGVIVAIAFNADSFNVARTLWNDAAARAEMVAIAQSTTNAPVPSPDGRTDEQKLKDAFDRTNKLHALPIGWSCVDGTWPLSCFPRTTFANLVIQILGWLLTAAALSLGAPFWFDLLSKFVNIRGTGPKPDRADAKK